MAKLQTLLELDPLKLMDMSESELRSAVRQMNSAANKRLKRWEGKIETAPVREARAGGKFSLKGAESIEDVRREYMRARNFLSNKYTTQAGAKELYDDLEQALIDDGYDVNRRDVKKLTQLNDILRSRDQSRESKYKALQEAGEILGETVKDTAQILYDLEAYFSEITGVSYGNNSASSGGESVSDFFEI